MDELAKKIAQELLNEFKKILDSDWAVNKRAAKWSGRVTLKGSRLEETSKVSVLRDGEGLKFSLWVNDYIDQIESGRGSGMSPHINLYDLIDWMKRRGIANGDTRVAYIIRNSIYERGIDPRPLINHYYDSIDEKFETQWSNEIFNEIIKELNKIFNK